MKNVESSTNSPMGSAHWFNTIMGRIKSRGEAMENCDFPNFDNYRVLYGTQIIDSCKELQGWFQRNYEKMPIEDNSHIYDTSDMD